MDQNKINDDQVKGDSINEVKIDKDNTQNQVNVIASSSHSVININNENENIIIKNHYNYVNDDILFQLINQTKNIDLMTTEGFSNEILISRLYENIALLGLIREFLRKSRGSYVRVAGFILPLFINNHMDNYKRRIYKIKSSHLSIKMWFWFGYFISWLLYFTYNAFKVSVYILMTCVYPNDGIELIKLENMACDEAEGTYNRHECVGTGLIGCLIIILKITTYVTFYIMVLTGLLLSGIIYAFYKSSTMCIDHFHKKLAIENPELLIKNLKEEQENLCRILINKQFITKFVI